MTDAASGSADSPEGSTEPHDTSQEDVEAAQKAAAQALEHIELTNVYPVSIHATASDQTGPPEEATLNIELQAAGGPGAFENRLTFSIEILDADGETAGQIEFTLQIDYQVEEGYEVPENAALYIARTTGLFGAYPYARELAQSLSARLQFDPFVLGLLSRGRSAPKTVTRVTSRDARSQREDSKEPAEGG